MPGERAIKISIHSPHTRGDRTHARNRYDDDHFNPLPSYEGRRERQKKLALYNIFQSTPLIRGETRPQILFCGSLVAISIHSPHTRGDDDDGAFS